MATAVFSLALSACSATDDRVNASSSPSDSSFTTSAADYRFPSKQAGDYTFSWTALEGVDLTSRAAEVVRAYFESCQLADRAVPYLYPGSLTANDWVFGGRFCLRRSSGFGIPFSGTIHARINHLTQSSTEITANVCLEPIGTYLLPDGNPPFATVRTTSRNMRANKPADVADPRENMPHVAAPGTGSRAPAYDAFYPWKMASEAPLQTSANARPSDCADFGRWVTSQVPAFAGQDPFEEGPDSREVPRRLVPDPSGSRGFPTLPQSPAWPTAG